MIDPYIEECEIVKDKAVMLNDPDGLPWAVIIFRCDGTFSRPHVPNTLGVRLNNNGQYAEGKELE